MEYLVVLSQETLNPEILPSTSEELSFHAMRKRSIDTEIMCQYLDQEPSQMPSQELALAVSYCRH